MNTFFKGLIMALVGFVATYISQSAGVINWAYIGIASGAFTLIYLAKNFAWPSISIYGIVNLQDLVSGLIMAIGMAVSNFAASLLTSTTINWSVFGTSVLLAVVGYFTKDIFSGQKDVPKDKISITGVTTGNVIKTLALLIGLSFMFSFNSSAQGFFGPKSAIQIHQNLKSTLGETVSPSYVWKFRPAVFVTADAIKVSGGIAVTQPLSSIGTGISYSKFIDNQGLPYEQVSISGLVMTNINLNGTALTTIGGGVIVGAFNGIVNLGGAYIGKQVYVLLGTKIGL
jgi:hypothetical protein